MAKYTENLNLETPEYTDKADIPALLEKNNNILDDAVGNSGKYVTLKSILETLPSNPEENIQVGERIYCSSQNKIYTLQENNIFDNGVVSKQKDLYFCLEDEKMYYYEKNEETLVPITTGRAVSLLNSKSNSTTDGYSCNYINNLSKTLWTNPEPTSTFDGQEITLSDDGYKTLTIYYYIYLNQLYVKSVTVPKGYNAILDCIFFYNNNLYWGNRNMFRSNDTTFTFGNAHSVELGTTSTNTPTNWLIPIMVVGNY